MTTLKAHRSDSREAAAALQRAEDGALHDVALRWRSGGASSDAPIAVANVVPFDRTRRDGAAATRRAPDVAADAASRPAGTWLQAQPARRMAALLVLSVAAHVGLYLPFHREPAPMSSIGQETISVEIVLGGREEAGLIKDKGTSSASAPTPMQAPEVVEQAKPTDVPPTEAAKLQTPPVVEPAAVADAKVKEPPPATTAEAKPAEAQPTKPEAVAQQPAEAPVKEAKAAPATTPAKEQPTEEAAPATPRSVAPVEARPEPAQAATIQAAPQTETAGEIQASVNPATEVTMETVSPARPPMPERRPPTAVAKRPEPRKPEARRPPARTRQAAVQRGERNTSRSTAPASAAAGGVGRGRSDSSTNYRGLVAAHLARHKQFPADARSRGAQGSAVVSFALNGGGRVTSVRLARASGVPSLDHEAVAMVRRASPFPAPPGGRAISFTVPVSFRLW